MTLYGILIAYVFIGCVYWLWMFVGTLRVVRAVPLLAQCRRAAAGNLAQALDHHSGLQ